MDGSETRNFSSEKQAEKSSDSGEERSLPGLPEEQVGMLSLEEGASLYAEKGLFNHDNQTPLVEWAVT